MPASNPFKPTFGRVPLCLAGREDILVEVTDALDGDGDAPCLTSLVVGARGTGKTALITRIANEGAARGWIAVNVAAGPGMLEDVYERALEGAAHLLEETDGSHLTAISIGQLLSVEWKRDDPVPGNWRTRMNRLLDELAQKQTGLLVTVDEVRADIPEMIEFAAVYQQFIREERRVALFMAGLPGNVNSLLTDKSVSFLRRAERYDLGRIADGDVRDALVRTAEYGGKDIDADALDLMVAAIDGYAYLIQLVGYRAWLAAGPAETLTAEAARAGIASARGQLAAKVFDVTLRELSAGDRRFLSAMVEEGRDATTVTVAARLGVTTSYASNYRRRLQDRGVISETYDGTLRFDLPGFGEYLAARSG